MEPSVKQSVSNYIPTWLDSHKDSFTPPVCNKLMHGPDGQLFVMYVGGPNIRKDFHLEEGEELFYMVKGSMCLRVLERGQFRDVIIKEGEIFLLPAHIPHSPQRNENTIGLVIERQRLPEEQDCIRYFMDNSANTLFERWLHCTNLGTQIATVIKEFFGSNEHATGKPDGNSAQVHPPFRPDTEKRLPAPFSLAEWLEANDERISTNGLVRLFDTLYQTDVFVVGGKETAKFKANPDAEHWIWQVQGSANIVCEEGGPTELRDRKYLLTENSSFLIKKGLEFMIEPLQSSYSETASQKQPYSMVVIMDPANKQRTRG